MKLMPFSAELCNDLLRDGYRYFVRRFATDDNIDGAAVAEQVVTFEAVRTKKAAAALPIKHVMHMPPASARSFYIMLVE